MAHFAKVVNSRVVQVIKAELDFFDTFIDTSPGDWIQTSYNTIAGVHVNTETRQPDDGVALRYNFATIDGYYDSVADAFYTAKPFDSWVLNTTTYLWEAPVSVPDDGNDYRWDEDNEQWVTVS